MPHVAFVTLSGFRVREQQLLELGMQLPGLQQRAAAIGALPALGPLTLAGLTPEHWTCSYHAVPRCDDALVETLVGQRPTLVAVSALTASIEEAYELCTRLRAENIRAAIGGLHASVHPSEAGAHADAVVVGEGELVWRRLLANAEADALEPEYRPQSDATFESWPLPRFELLGPDRPARVTLQTQRGCPLGCEFCGASRLLGPFREKPRRDGLCRDRPRESLGGMTLDWFAALGENWDFGEFWRDSVLASLTWRSLGARFPRL
ncbi:MAG: hypothetical protein CMJ48_11905 [Planctomycetaceae bacterium]|nr:hypothetical protein [Planctomycetaceae bacterium]